MEVVVSSRSDLLTGVLRTSELGRTCALLPIIARAKPTEILHDVHVVQDTINGKLMTHFNEKLMTINDKLMTINDN